MLSEKLRQYVNPQAEDDRELLLQLLKQTLPVSDLCSVTEETLLSYVRHGLHLRKHSPFCKEVPEDIFLHFVFYPRVNNEELTDCRDFFREKIKRKVAGLTTEEAALAINRWCCGRVTYRSSDDRTKSPLATYQTGHGRCGEESVFTVTVLRSAGIPARQIYVPWWSHCDDNHAWVEVYVNGAWKYLGACEPEPILNRGWFTDAAGRAKLAVYRTFFDYRGEGMQGEELIEKQGSVCIYNATSRYTETKHYRFKTTDEQGRALPHAKLTLSLPNMAALRPLVKARTDEQGYYDIRLGAGDLYKEAYQNGPGKTNTTELITFTPGAGCGMNRSILTEEEQEANARVISEAGRKRRTKIKERFLPLYWEIPDRGWQRILQLAGGNAPEIYDFYEILSAEERGPAREFLETLRDKDYGDISCRLLTAFWKDIRSSGQLSLLEEAEGEQRQLCLSYLLCPRVEDEVIEDYRSLIREYFTEDQLRIFRENPKSFRYWIREHMQEPEAAGVNYYPSLAITPAAALRSGCCDRRGRHLLFVAAMRTLGIPARLDPLTGAAEYLTGEWRTPDGRGNNHEKWIRVGIKSNASMALHNHENRILSYGRDFTISRWDPDRGEYILLGDCGLQLAPGRSRVIHFPAGDYRLVTTNRLPNGRQHCRISFHRVGEKERSDLILQVTPAAPAEMLSHYDIDPFSLQSEDGSPVTTDGLLSRHTLIAFLDVEKEPTEHILNEICAAAAAIKAKKGTLQVIFVLKDPADRKDTSLQKAIAAVPDCRICYDSFKGMAIALARKLYLEPGVWPLIMLLDEEHKGLYGVCGYRVGTVDLLLKMTEV